jgi:predicted RNA-binding protein YlxR (DUF448 family)
MKKELIRIVRSPEGGVQVDPTGKAKGRGAYLCTDSACWEQALKRRALASALKTEIDSETTEYLREFATGLESDTMSS